MSRTTNLIAAGSTSCPAVQEQARIMLESLFVKVPRSSDIDFHSVVLALDAVHGRTSGRVSSRGFFLTRHSTLNGRAPIDVIAEPDGPRRIWQLVDEVSAAF